MEATDDTVWCNGTFTVTLPAIVANESPNWEIVNKGSGVITIDATTDAQTTINDVTSDTICPYGSFKVSHDNTEYWNKNGCTLKHEYIQPTEDSTGNVGNWGIVTINATQSVHFIFVVPPSFKRWSSVSVAMIPDATETIQYDVLTSESGPGLAYNVDDLSSLDITQDVTADEVYEADITSLLGGATADDYVTIDFQSDTANLRIIGLHMDYY